MKTSPSNDPSKIKHWDHPRKTIAIGLSDLDYATHGANLAMQVLNHLDMKPSELHLASFLDYGCGTGRVARPLSNIFGHVFGYDPNQPVIKEALATTQNHSIGYVRQLPHFDHKLPGRKFDYGCSINVMEHLSHKHQLKMIEDLKKFVTGPVVLWYSIAKNGPVVNPYLSGAQKERDAYMVSTGRTIQVRKIYLHKVS